MQDPGGLVEAKEKAQRKKQGAMLNDIAPNGRIIKVINILLFYSAALAQFSFSFPESEGIKTIFSLQRVGILPQYRQN